LTLRRAIVIAALVAIAATALILYRNYRPGEQRSAEQAQSAPGSPAGPAAQGRGRRAAPAVTPVVSAQAVEENFIIRRRTIGALESPAVVTVRSRLNSQVLQQHVRDGQFVNRDDLLFTLDDREVRAALAQAEAQLAKDQATLARTELDLKRARELIARNAAPQTQLETATAENQGAIATVQSDQAQIATARIRVSYAKITAPMDGRIGTIRIAPGNLITANDDVGLTTLTQMQPLRVSFTLPERDLAELRAAAQRSPPTQVRVYPPGATKPLAEGYLDFVDTSVDVNSGTIAARATFANQDLALWPGQFVDVEIDLDSRPRTVMVPTVAIQSGQQGPFIFVMAGDTAQLRKVVLVAGAGDRTALASGVKPGERVIVEGQMKLVDGARVREAPAHPYQPTPAAGASPSEPGGAEASATR
jgi:multidrug efflux system membrane fusion protein